MKAFNFIRNQRDNATRHATVYYLWNVLKNMFCQRSSDRNWKANRGWSRFACLIARTRSGKREAGSGSSEWIWMVTVTGGWKYRASPPRPRPSAALTLDSTQLHFSKKSTITNVLFHVICFVTVTTNHCFIDLFYVFRTKGSASTGKLNKNV